jgi:hypothetical protein
MNSGFLRDSLINRKAGVVGIKKQERLNFPFNNPSKSHQLKGTILLSQMSTSQACLDYTMTRNSLNLLN